MTKVIIVACDKNGIIGCNGKIPWYFPEDLARFKKLTTGHAVLMGRKTFDSILEQLNTPLPGRMNIVVSRERAATLAQRSFTERWLPVKSNQLDAKFAFHAVTTIKDGLHWAQKEQHRYCFIIGGAEIYNQTLNIADEIDMTLVPGEYSGDVYFPLWPITWKMKSSEDGQKGLIHRRYIRS